MDILKKMFQSELEQQQQQQKEQEASASASNKDEFRKPQWFEEAETDDELFDDDRKFAFQVFTSPLEMEKHFERQLQRILESMHENEDSGFERNLREDFLKPGFESKILKEFQKKDNALDTDLDGEIYPEQLYSLIQRLNPEEGHEDILPSNQRGLRKGLARRKLTDEELIMGRIHGTLNADGECKPPGVMLPPPSRPPPPNGKPNIMTPMTPFGGVFDGTYQGPKMFSQSVMTKTVRKPDGTYETTKVTQDSTGQKTTTVTRVVDGRKETTISKEGGTAASKGLEAGAGGEACLLNRNIFVTKEGYAMPRNLW